MQHLILIRLAAELTLKSKRTRAQFTHRLKHNIRDAMNGSGFQHEITGEWGRMYLRTDSAAALPMLARIFGISSVSPVDATVPADVGTIVERGHEIFRDRVAGKRFAVRGRRVGEHEFRSKDIEIALGAALLPYAERVDLSRPEVTVQVEIRREEAYLFSERVEAVGGLPTGVEGRAVALISGGFDSAVSAWLMLKRGVELDYVFCNLGGDAYERAVLQVAKAIADDWSYGTQPRLFVVDFAEPLRELRATVRPNHWQVVLKRLMYRAASSIGEELGAHAIITGEAIGQVSSQTLPNLRAIESASSLPVFRPLLGFDKEEIIERARHIGTAALSEQVKEYCAIAPGRTVTATTERRAADEDGRMNPAALADALRNRRTLDLRALTPTDLVAPYIFTTEIPENAVIFDCRTEAQFLAWHLPGAEQRDEWDLLREYKRFDRDRKYVLYCAHGIQSAHLAEKMQSAGLEAYSFRGGIRGVLAYARARGEGEGEESGPR